MDQQINLKVSFAQRIVRVGVVFQETCYGLEERSVCLFLAGSLYAFSTRESDITTRTNLAWSQLRVSNFLSTCAENRSFCAGQTNANIRAVYKRGFRVLAHSVTCG